MFRNLCFILLLTGLVSCIKDKPVPAPAANVTTSGLRIFILNEGNYGTGNASVSQYDEKTGTLVEDIYKQVNSENLGDVLQSMALAERYFYLVMNNSGKVVVCDKQLKKTGQITGLTSPRYFIAVDRHKGYVSDLAANRIHVVDLRTHQVTHSIPCHGWTEHMVRTGEDIVVTNVKSEYVYFIASKTDQITDSVKVAKNASGLVVDDQNKVWVLTGGDEANKVEARLYRVDPVTRTVLDSRPVGNVMAGGLCTNGRRDKIFYLAKHIYRLNITEEGAGTLVVPGSDKTIYGFGVHPDSGKIFAADAVDFSQRSTIYEYDESGNEIRVFKAGIISNGFYFE